MQLANTANYTSDEGTCNSNWALNNTQRISEGLPSLPNTCAGNTFDLVPTGGYTGDTAGITEDASGNPVTVTPASVAGVAPNAYVPQTNFTIAAATPAPAIAVATADGSAVSDGSSTAAGIVSSGTSFFGQDVAIAGEEIPVWGLIAAGVALLFMVKR
jgi:hypothetical protein